MGNHMKNNVPKEEDKDQRINRTINGKSHEN